MKAPVRIALVIAAVVGLAAAGGSSAPAGMTAQNQWFPLKPGTVFVYRGTEDGDALRDVVTVTNKTKVIQGTRCIVVEDRLYRNGRLVERTTDWYWLDRTGTSGTSARTPRSSTQEARSSAAREAGRPVATEPHPASSCRLTPGPGRTGSRSTTRATPRTSSGSSA